MILRLCEIPSSLLNPNQVGIKNSEQILSQVLAFTTKKIAGPIAEVMSVVCPAIFLLQIQAVVKKLFTV